MRRGLVWAFTLPLVAGGVLGAHALAYAIVRAPAADFHGYLGHAPQLIAVLATLAACTLAVQGRTRAPVPRDFVVLALAAFFAQEHLERFVHTGELPWLLTRPEFLLGLILQLPAALLVWLLARFFLVFEPVASQRPPRLSTLSLGLLLRRYGFSQRPLCVALAARGPPVLP